MESNPDKDYKRELVEGPTKCVRVLADMYDWQQSEAYYDLMGFINGISTAIQGICITDDIEVSPQVEKLLNIIEKLDKLIDETPPINQPQRFGNKAYRSWSHKMHHSINLLLQAAIPTEKCELVTELGSYLGESFGNAVRLDYGTGHELSFLFFLCALFKSGILAETDNVACALRLFNAYLDLVRRLQKTYRMEPAGSQGVWSLDDYQFVPFIWGSAQLAKNAPFDPIKFLDDAIIEKYKDAYLFIGCIDYIKQVKTGHFAEHSNQLWSISAVHSWIKINSGLVKMYQKEILSKYPIIQHVMFGKLMSFKAIALGTHIPAPNLGPEKPVSKQTLTHGFHSFQHGDTNMPPPPPPSMASLEMLSTAAAHKPITVEGEKVIENFQSDSSENV